MKQSDIPLMKLPNREAAIKFIEVDDAYEAEHGQSILGPVKTFLQEILDDTKDSIVPNAFSNVLNARLQGKLPFLPDNMK